MTQDTFIKLIRAVAESHGSLHGSMLSKTAAVARKYSDPLNVPEAMQALREIFGNTLDRHEYADIEKKLSRY